MQASPELTKLREELAPHWERLTPPCTADVLDAVKQSIQTEAPFAVLDYGCHTGRLCRFLTRHLPDIHVDGIDVSEGMLEQARKNCPDSTFFLGEQTDWRAARYDVIVSKDLFNNLNDIPATLKRFHYLLRPHGTIVIALRNIVPGKVEQTVNTLNAMLYSVSFEHLPWLIPPDQLDAVDAAVQEIPEEHQTWARDRVRKPGDYCIITARRD
jgi:trans-aconitate methyltransferase